MTAKRHTVTNARTQQCAAVARQHPDWSLRMIEAHLNLKPRNYASTFKKGTRARADEERCYAERLDDWKKRNA